MVSTGRQQQASVLELRRRIAGRVSFNPKNVPLAQAIDLAALYGRDPAEFRDIIAKGELKRRKAYYLLKVGQLLKTGTLTTPEAEKVGWTKLQIVADKMTEKNAARLLRLARDNSAQELKRIMHEDGQKPAPHCVMMYLGRDQYRQFRTAMLAHGASSIGRGLVGKEQALMRLIRLAASE